MNRKSFSTLIILLALSMVLVACGKNAEGENEGKIKLLVAHNQTSPDNPYQVGLLEFKKVAEEESEGAIEVEVHAGTLGTQEEELVQKLKLGGVDLALVSPSFMTQTGIKEIDLLAFPYLFDDYDHWERVVDGAVGEAMADLMKEKSKNDFNIVGYWSAGVRHYYGKKPLTSIDDLKGLTIRTQTSGVVSDYWTKIGAIPTSVAWGELYQALQQNVVDSSENSFPYYVQQNHHKTDNGKYTTETGHDYTTRFLLVNGDKFEEYTEEQQAIILKAADAATKAEREALYAQEDEYKENLLDDGALINEIDRQPFIDAAIEVQDRTAESIGAKELLQQIRDLK